MRKCLAFLSIYKRTVLFTSICLFFSLLLNLLSRNAEGFAQWYSVTIYPVFPATIGRFFSNWEHSFFEAGILSSAIAIGILFLTSPWFLLGRSTFRKICFSISFRSMACLAAGLVLIYSLTCSVNYHRDSIGRVLNLPEEAATKDNLVKLCFLLADELTTLTNDPDWDYSLLAVNDAAYIEMEAVNSMRKLGELEPSLSGYYPEPKPVYFSKTLSGMGIEGIFSPFTLEANYNSEMTPFLVPYTICHELAHLKGYMKEDDAGFIAYLACRNSPSMVFQYSGIFHALIFSLNALNSEADAEEYNQIYQKLPEPVRIQLSYIKEQNQQKASSYRSVAKSVNNAYLKANAQPGMISYGRIVELLISDYAERINDDQLL